MAHTKKNGLRKPEAVVLAPSYNSHFYKTDGIGDRKKDHPAAQIMGCLQKKTMLL